jgi:hypothetical protein
MIKDGLHSVYAKLGNERSPKTLFDRFPGIYRALVVETNDPLNMHRIRFKMPEMHDFDLNPQDCPYASPCFNHGGKNTGFWCAPKIGDIVWISFEKQHPYGPVYIGHAEPTRRRFYKLQSIYQNTQVYVDEEGKPEKSDDIAWQEDYLPKDGRPYSMGLKDRYGNMLVFDETGFYPSEHDVKPAPNESDPISQSDFEFKKFKPQKNDPDKKMISMISKYGHYLVLGDQGYDWESDFSGDFVNDHEIEKARTNNLIRTLNENNAKDRDQRRIELRSGYGHKLELRDVGWASAGPISSQSRENDWFENESQQSESSANDERWIKIRTKAGHVMQFMDMGADPSEDEFIRRNRIDEVGGLVDGEDDNWQDRDSRQMRFVTRYGFKLVMDDRGSDPSNADGLEDPRGNGWLIKGRRGNKGYGWEVNEKDELNRSLMYTPDSKIFEMNDRFGYVMTCTDTSESISREWQKLAENEFALSSSMTFDPEKDTYHCKLDKNNGYIRLKTPEDNGLSQGFESRNQIESNSVWTEINDRDNRALICNSSDGFTAWHDPDENKFILIDDNSSLILIRNKDGKIQIHSSGNIEFKSDANIVFDAQGISLNSQSSPFVVNAQGSGQFVVDATGAGTNLLMNASQFIGQKPDCQSGGGAGTPSPKTGTATPFVASAPPTLTPADRGKTYNGPFDEVSESVVTG